MKMNKMIIEIVKNKGVQGLFAGMRVDIARVIPANALMFLIFESMRKSNF